MKTRKIRNLDRKLVVAAAFAQLEEHGLDSLTMRRLAARLGVQGPALYGHIADKAELLALMASDIYGEAYAAIGPAPDPVAWLVSFGRALRNVFLHYRDAARLCAIAGPVRGSREIVEIVVSRPLIAFGMDAAHAHICQAAVFSLSLGWATYQANQPMRHLLDELLDFDASFELALKGLATGLVIDEHHPTVATEPWPPCT